MTRRPLPARPLWIRQLVGSLGLALFSLVAATSVVGILPIGIGLIAVVGVLMSGTYFVG